MSEEWRKLGYTGREWFQIPMELRQRWWNETDFGKKAPSPALVEEVRKQITTAKEK
jgi:hypothetical protein